MPRNLIDIENFIHGLRQIETCEHDIVYAYALYAYLRTHPVSAESLRPSSCLGEARPMLSRLFKNELFEVILLFLQGGQATQIFRLGGSYCCIAAITGTLEVRHYRAQSRDAERKTCALVEGKNWLLTPYEPIQLLPDEPVHQVKNLTESVKPAAALYVGSRPFGAAERYYDKQGVFLIEEIPYL